MIMFTNTFMQAIASMFIFGSLNKAFALYSAATYLSLYIVFPGNTY